MEPGALVAVVTVLSNQERPRVADLYREVARLSVMFSHICTILAHQGGWDEILLVAGPIGVIVGLLAIVKKRLDRSIELRNSQVDPLDQSTDRD